MRTLNGLLLRTREGLNLDESPFLPQPVNPPYVDAGVASVEALLAELNTEDTLVDVLVRLVGLVGV